MMNRILIANRGEIVARIMRTARDMGMEVVVLYTADDMDHTYIKQADKAVLLNGTSLTETFLNKEKIIDIALSHKADAIHPGYGFLSENADFAEMCETVGIRWIGPSPDVIRLMGYKRSAREFAEKAGVPVLKANYGTAEELLNFTQDLHFPVMIKAQAGGGGKGMRIVHSPDDFSDALHITGKEADLFFGDASLYVEEYIEDARHIEVQILGDDFGKIVHLYERECSVQRRHQKLIEEAPAASLSDEKRREILESAVKIARAAKYKNAGTVEFIVDRTENFYFLEMNTRLQVEHPVTELVTGIDVVKEQLLVAAGHALAFEQDEVICRGHALECRLYAEDPEQGFMPQNGTLTLNAAPFKQSVRVDGSFEKTAKMSSAYDPLVAKVITDGSSRLEAMKNMIGALEDYKIQGVKTNKGFLTNLLKSPEFLQNNITTQYCDLHADRHFETIVEPDKAFALIWFFIHIYRHRADDTVWNSLGNWRHLQRYTLRSGDSLFSVYGYRKNEKEWELTVNDARLHCSPVSLSSHKINILVNQVPVKAVWSEAEAGAYFIDINNSTHLVRQDIVKRRIDHTTRNKAASCVVSPLPGRVMRVYVSPGERVSKGKAMLVIESMKIENRIVADHDSIIKNVLVSEGQQLNGNDLVIELE